jgi:hypothetical protein
MIASRIDVAIRSIDNLPPFEAGDALSLSAVCRLGLVPGHGGRRLDPSELERWAIEGVQLAWGEPRFLFPSVRINGELLTTPAWCSAWVDFVSAEQRAHLQHAKTSTEEDSQQLRERHYHFGNAGFQPSA